MNVTIKAAFVAALLGAASVAPAHALGPVSDQRIAPDAPIESIMTAAKERRLYMMRSLQGQAMRQQGYGRGPGYGHRHGYGGGGRGYGPGYGRPRRDRW